MNNPTNQLTQLLTVFHEIFQDWMNTGKIQNQHPSEFLRMQAELLQLPPDEVMANPAQAFLQLIELINTKIQTAPSAPWQHLTTTLQKYNISLDQNQGNLLGQLQQLMNTAEPIITSTDSSESTPTELLEEEVLNHPVWQEITQFSGELKDKFQASSANKQQYQQLNDLLQQVSQQLKTPQTTDMEELAQELENKVIEILGLETKEAQDEKNMEEYRSLARQSIAESLAKFGIESKHK